MDRNWRVQITNILDSLENESILENIPEFKLLRDMNLGGDQGYKNIYNHIINVMKNLYKIIEKDEIDNGCNELHELLVYAALLHDIGKPYSIELHQDPENGTTWTFKNHEKIGAVVARKEILPKLYIFSDKEMDKIEIMISLHHQPANLKEANFKGIRRFLKDSQGLHDMILLLSRADVTTKNGVKALSIKTSLDVINEKIKQIHYIDAMNEFRISIKAPHIEEQFGIPIKQAGSIFRKIRQKVFDGELEDNPDILINEARKIIQEI